MKIMPKAVATTCVATLVALGAMGTAGAVEAEGTYDPVVCTGNTVLVGGECVDAQSTRVGEGVSAVAAAVDTSGTLPYTGSDSSIPMAEIGVGLLAAGGLTVVMVRRRQVASQS